MYRAEVDWSPAYELLVSLKAFAYRPEHKTLDLGIDWIKRVRQSLTPDFAARLSSKTVLSHVGLLDLLVWQSPHDRNASGFIEWLGGLSAGELYERLERYVPQPKMLADLGGMRDSSVSLLAAWNEQYFRRVDGAILEGLCQDAAAKRELLEKLPAEEVVEQATNGVRFTPEPPAEIVLLVPQYHYRPWNLFATYRTMRLIEYPADALPSAPGEPPSRLLRLTRALSDDNRLRILCLLAERPLSFTDVVRATGLSKSTVHHHMVTLRAASLVRVETAGDKASLYTLREDTVDGMGELLRSYLGTSRKGE